MFFAATAAAQQQEQRMMDRIMNPDRDRSNPMGAKAFSAKPFEGREFQGAVEYTGVKAARTKEFTTREFLGIRNPWFGKRVYATEAARELNRYVLADRDYSSRSFETRPRWTKVVRPRCARSPARTTPASLWSAARHRARLMWSILRRVR
jgi:hypothetical protein